MAKSLYLVRHAKSDWTIPGTKDFDRDLNSRGINDAPKMGRLLFEQSIYPDLILSSPAVRAKATTEYIAEQLKFDPEKTEYDENIYEASLRTLLSVINQLNEKYSKVMIVGHNPGFTYLAEYLSKEVIGDIPTCGVIGLEFELEKWSEISGGTGKIKFYLYPKKDLEQYLKDEKE